MLVVHRNAEDGARCINYLVCQMCTYTPPRIFVWPSPVEPETPRYLSVMVCDECFEYTVELYEYIHDRSDIILCGFNADEAVLDLANYLPLEDDAEDEWFEDAQINRQPQMRLSA